MSAEVGVEEAYAHCEAVTRAEAANFFYGIRLLADEQRRAMCAAYAFARRVDDIGDGSLAPPEEKLRLLDAEARALAVIEHGPGAPIPAEHHADAVMVALRDACSRFPIPPQALGELIEGVRMDVEGVRYADFEELVVYCRRVAGAIGRVCLAIFGVRQDAALDGARAAQLADDLGVALQLTNILRDVREDAENGRVYLPLEDLRRFEIFSAHPGGPAGGEGSFDLRAAIALGGGARDGAAQQEQSRRLAALMRFEAERARQWFDRGLALVPLLDRRSAACVLAMAGIYRRLLERIDAHPEKALRERMSVPAHEKAWVAARGMLGVGA